MAFDGVRIFERMDQIPRGRWDALLDGSATPFMRWDWLDALERSGCASAEAGWLPRHLTFWKGGELLAAAPAYVKDGSDGDFSRDWDWASAAVRAGLAYYPKLCLTVPFTPATGRRILVAKGVDRPGLVRSLLAGARRLCKDEKVPSLQILFPDEQSARELEAAGLALRVSHQFHWRNEGYRTPEDFLARFNSKRRNMVKRERAAPAKQGISIRTVRGPELDAGWAHAAYKLHRHTVDKLMWGRRWLNEDFYQRIFSAMPEDLEVVAAEHEGRLIAGAFNVVSKTHLYGRYWGAFEDHPFLHFNVCLYHSIDECIRRGLEQFEGGAGGEHKLPRGFLPAVTYSAHASLEPRLDRALRESLPVETQERKRSIEQFAAESPILKARPPAEAP
jgi:predicted N-acyltransferase